jgi:hypothetical protein
MIPTQLPRTSSNTCLYPALFPYPLSFHIDPHSAPVTPLFLTHSSKPREGEGTPTQNPRQMPLSASRNPSFRATIPYLGPPRRKQCRAENVFRFAPHRRPGRGVRRFLSLSTFTSPLSSAVFCTAWRHFPFWSSLFSTTCELFCNYEGGGYPWCRKFCTTVDDGLFVTRQVQPRFAIPGALFAFRARREQSAPRRKRPADSSPARWDDDSEAYCASRNKSQEKTKSE